MRVAPLVFGLVGLGPLVAGCDTPEPSADSEPMRSAPADVPPETGDEHRLDAELASVNARCEGCHRTQAEQWRNSLHRTSFSNDAFATSFARTPFPFCRDCHAPEGAGKHLEPRTEAQVWAADNGVACVTCHLNDSGQIITASPSTTSGPPAPHPVVRDPDFSTAAACDGCHEFEFPGRPQPAPAGLMQRTLLEHAQSDFAQLTCSDCHMPRVETETGTVRDHTFAASREPSILRAALKASASRPTPDVLALHLTPVGVGHAFPTGDLFRRLSIVATATDPDGRVTDKAQRYLARHFEPARRGRPRPETLEDDDRLTGPTTLTVPLPRARAADTVTWTVSYQRVDHRVALHPERSTLHGEIELARGSL